MDGRTAGDPLSAGIGELEPRADAIERYWQTIQAQMTFLERIDSKAQRLVRYAVLLVGIVLTAMSFATRSEAVALAGVSTTAKATFVAGFGLLLAAIGFAGYTSLNSNLQYGLGKQFGHRVADGIVESPDYERIVLNTHTVAASLNQIVVNTNAERYRKSLLSLLLGLYYIALSGPLALLSVGKGTQVLALFAASVPAAVFAHHIQTGNYLVLEREW